MPGKRGKPTAKARKPDAMDKMIADCVRKSRERKRSGETDATWRKDYAATLKVSGPSVPLSDSPFDGDTLRKKP